MDGYFPLEIMLYIVPKILVHFYSNKKWVKQLFRCTIFAVNSGGPAHFFRFH